MVNFRKMAKSCVSMAAAVAMTAGIAGIIPAENNNNLPSTAKAAATVATVNLSKTYQNIRGFGGIDLPEWQGYSLNDSELALAFGNGPGQLGLTVLRVFVNPDKSQWSKGLKTAQYASKAGATLFATPWEPPSNIRENGAGQRAGAKYHLNKNNYAAYAQHLNDFGNYMKSNGAPLYSISVQNEPDFASEWTRWSTDETTDFLANYADRITSAKVMSPESFQYSPSGASWIAGGDGGKKYYEKILNNAKAFANCDLFGTHFYGTTRDWMDYPALENSGKEIWMTEVYVPGSDYQNANIWTGKDKVGVDDAGAINVAVNIHNGMVVGNMSAYVWWYIKRYYSLIGQQYTQKERNWRDAWRPTVEVMSASEAGKVTKRGYALAQYSKWVRPGYRRTEVTEQPQNNVLVSAYKGENNKVVIVAINKGSSEVNQQFEISGQTITSAVRYRTTGSENLAETKMSPSGSGFNSQLPANSVSTYVCTISGNHGIDGSDMDSAPGAIVLEPDANGYYYHDTFENGTDDWNARGSVKTELSGRAPYEGANALVISERTATWNGISKTLPSSTFKAGEKFAFSACVNILDADVDTETVKLTLQYDDGSGTTKYANIDSKTCTVGNYVQLYNPGYQIPDGASNLQLVVETDENTMNFYVDEVIVAVAGTNIAGPKEQEIVTTTEATTAAPVTTTVTTATTKAPEEFKGDADGNGVVNSLDLVKLVQHLISVTTIEGDAFRSADMNDDGKLTIIDAIMLRNRME